MGTTCSCGAPAGDGAQLQRTLRAHDVDAELARKQRADQDREQRKIKLLLLGAGESGKSTILKQMRILYGTGYSDDERRAMIGVVHQNTIVSMKALVLACNELGYALDADISDAARAVMRTPDDAIIDTALSGSIAALWTHPSVQRAYAERSKFQLNDSAAYFFDKLSAIVSPDYTPSVDDVLKTRVRTSGIIEEAYVIDGVPFVIFDVGGQRNERRKWIHCFEDVTAILFVAALSEYDQTLFEDNQVNRLVEALNLFASICASRYFESTPVILFLNKRDLFAEKIKSVPLRQRNPDVLKAAEQPFLFDDYAGGADESQALDYIVRAFLARNTNPKKSIFWQVTCATDTDNVRVVFASTKEIILKNNLISSGFMD